MGPIMIYSVATDTCSLGPVLALVVLQDSFWVHIPVSLDDHGMGVGRQRPAQREQPPLSLAGWGWREGEDEDVSGSPNGEHCLLQGSPFQFCPLGVLLGSPRDSPFLVIPITPPSNPRWNSLPSTPCRPFSGHTCMLVSTCVCIHAHAVCLKAAGVLCFHKSKLALC